MSTESVAHRLVELCRIPDLVQAQAELYAEDARSVEPHGAPWESCQGIAALNDKVSRWLGMIEELHGAEVSDPVVADPFFSVRMGFDLTVNGQRFQFAEIAVYEVRDDKIVLEHFFYTPLSP